MHARTCILGLAALAAAGLRGVPSQATLRHREGVKGVRTSIVDQLRGTAGLARVRGRTVAWLQGCLGAVYVCGSLCKFHKRREKFLTASFYSVVRA